MITKGMTLLAVASKSLNANSFGLKMHIFMSEKGMLYEGAASAINERSQGSSFYVKGTTDNEVISSLIRLGFELTHCRGKASPEIFDAVFPNMVSKALEVRHPKVATQDDTDVLGRGLEDNSDNSNDIGIEIHSSEIDGCLREKGELERAEELSRAAMYSLEKFRIADSIEPDDVAGFIVAAIKESEHDYEVDIQDLIDTICIARDMLYGTG